MRARPLALSLFAILTCAACGKGATPPPEAPASQASAAPLPAPATPTSAAPVPSAGVLKALGETPQAAAPPEDATPVDLAQLLTDTALQGARYKPLRDEKHTDRRIYGVVLPGSATGSFDDMLRQVKEWRGRLASPQQGLAVLWEGNRRRAFCVWDDETAALRASASAWDARVQDPADYKVSALPAFTTTVNYGGGALYDAKCQITVKNLGAVPIDLELGCGYKILKGSEFAPQLKRQKVGKLAPGVTKKYDVKIGRGNDLPSSDGLHLYVDGAEVQYFNQYAWDDATDYAKTVDPLWAQFGARPQIIGDWNDFSMPTGNHSSFYHLLIEGFAMLDDAARTAAAKAMHKAFAAHNSKFHGAALLILSASDGDVRWNLSATGAELSK